MTKSQRTMVLAGALLLATAAMLGFRAGRVQAEPSAVAVIDLFKLMNGLEEWAAIDAELNAKLSEYEAEIEQSVKELQLRQEELQALAVSKEEEFEKRAALLELNDAVESRRKRSTLILQFYENVRMIDLYEKISLAVAEFSEEQGYDLVLIRSDTSSFGPLRDNIPPQQLRELMVLRQTMYVANATDITDAVVQKMNNAFTLNP